MSKLLNPNAAGIDIGSKINYVAVPEDRDAESVRSFGTYTCELKRLVDWLITCKIDTVAMESTGIYWYHLFTMLDDAGIDVYLVNAHHIKKVPGRKSDVVDAQWIQRLHSAGLLNKSFQPDNLTRKLRTIMRLRKSIIEQIGTQIQRQQKSLEQRNLKLHQVLSDIDGKSGRKIIEAIIDGQTDPIELYSHVDKRVKASRANILAALEGNWREDQLFVLEISYNQMVHLESQLQLCDKKIERIIQQFQTGPKDQSIKPNRKEKRQPAFNVNQYLANIYGVQVTKIPGFKNTTALTVLAEIGPDVKEKFPTLKQFLSWLNLVPDNDITGGKIVKRRRKKKHNKAGLAFRASSNALWNAKNPLGDLMRSKKAQKGASTAIIIVAKKLASIFYTMVTEKREYNEKYVMKDKANYYHSKLKKLQKSMNEVQNYLTEYQSIS